MVKLNNTKCSNAECNKESCEHLYDVDKKQVINEKCNEYWAPNKVCFDCPLWEYFRSPEHKCRNCVEIPLDIQYALMTKGGL